MLCFQQSSYKDLNYMSLIFWGKPAIFEMDKVILIFCHKQWKFFFITCNCSQNRQPTGRICADKILVPQKAESDRSTAIKSKDIHSTFRVHCVYVPHKRYAESLKVLRQAVTGAPIPRKCYANRRANLIPQTPSSPAFRL